MIYLPVLFLFLSVFPYKNKIVNISLVFIGLYLLFLVTGFKGDFMPDYGNYLSFFEYTKRMDGLSVKSLQEASQTFYGLEYGYIILSYLLSSVGLSFNFLLVIISLFSLVCLLCFASLFDNYIRTSVVCLVVVLLFDFWFIQSRMLVSTSFFILSIVLFVRSNYVAFFVSAILSLSFHSLGVLSFFVVLFNYINLCSVKIYIMVLFGAILLTFFNILGFLEVFFIDHRYLYYFVESDKFNTTSLPFIIRVISYTFWVYFIFVSGFFNRNHSKLEKILFGFLLLSLFSWAVATKIPIVYRVGMVCDISILIFYSLIPTVKSYVFKATLFLYIALVAIKCVMGFYQYDSFFFDWV